MYNEYFGFKEAPFSIAPDPRYLYMTAQHRDALAHLVFGLNSEGGCILLTGEVGTGKTTICRCLLEQIPDEANVALLLNPKVNEIELLETVCDELHISYPDSANSVKTYTDRIYQFLIESNRRNEKTVLIIDEAQNLDSKVLEQLRLLTNLETNQRKLLQIIILGQPELLDILARSEMRQLAQRITARFHLEPLNKHEVKAYISHRLAVAGQNIQLFPESSSKLLYKLSKGVPRLINIICDRALLGAYVENQYSVTPGIMKKAAIEVFGELKNVEKHQQQKRWLYPIAALAGVAIVVFLITYYFTSTDFKGLQAIPEIGHTPSDELNDTLSNNIEETGNADADDIAQTSTVETASGDDVANEPAMDSDSDTDTAMQVATNEHTDMSATITTDSDVTNAVNNDEESTANNLSGAQKDGIITTDMKTIINNAPLEPAPAYQELFRAWDIPFNSKTRQTACQQAEKFSLSCLFKTGSINSLKLHNRPAVLTLINNRGGKRYIAITAIDDGLATINSSDRPYKIELQDLNRYWRGEFTLLWNRPDYYSSAITPGDSGSIVNWLKLQLDKVNNAEPSDFIVSNYDDKLIDRVKTFQTEQGLAADGIVGPVTIIHLYKKLGKEAPTLMNPPLLSVLH